MLYCNRKDGRIMATFKDRDIFEFCENLYVELKKQDNGYYPHKHDKIVFQKAAENFDISEDEVDRIYDSYTKCRTSHYLI